MQTPSVVPQGVLSDDVSAGERSRISDEFRGRGRLWTELPFGLRVPQRGMGSFDPAKRSASRIVLLRSG
jgi:hypothetical protein